MLFDGLASVPDRLDMATTCEREDRQILGSSTGLAQTKEGDISNELKQGTFSWSFDMMRLGNDALGQHCPSASLTADL